MVIRWRSVTLKLEADVRYRQQAMPWYAQCSSDGRDTSKKGIFTARQKPPSV